MNILISLVFNKVKTYETERRLIYPNLHNYKNVKEILIVEDEKELAENLQELLQTLDFNVLDIFSNAKDTLEYLKKRRPDLIIMDVLLEGTLDGVQLTQVIKEKYDIPVLFLTAYSDNPILEKISNVTYDGFLLKPFDFQRLKSAVFLAINRIQFKEKTDRRQKYLKIRDKGFLSPVSEDRILYLQADGMYTKVVTKDKTYMIRDILKDVSGKLSDKKFIRIHKSYIVNVSHIASFNSKEVIVNQTSLPVRRGLYKKLRELIISRLS